MLRMRRTWHGSSLTFLFVTVFVDMIGYGIVIPLLPFYVQQYAPGAVLIGLLGSLYAAMQFFGGPLLGGISDRAGHQTEAEGGPDQAESAGAVCGLGTVGDVGLGGRQGSASAAS